MAACNKKLWLFNAILNANGDRLSYGVYMIIATTSAHSHRQKLTFLAEELILIENNY